MRPARYEPSKRFHGSAGPEEEKRKSWILPLLLLPVIIIIVVSVLFFSSRGQIGFCKRDFAQDSHQLRFMLLNLRKTVATEDVSNAAIELAKKNECRID